jgi:hypothetical protein
MISQKLGSKWLNKGRVKARATRGSRLPGPAPTSRRFGVLSVSSIVVLFRIYMRVSSFYKLFINPRKTVVRTAGEHRPNS